jgi:N-acetylneuraminic acid mutarotase
MATNFFGLPFLKPGEIEDCFVEDLFSEAPQDSRCEQFADYVLNTYITDTRFPPTVWAEEPSETKRTNNGAESFHAHFNEQFYIHHPSNLWNVCSCPKTVTD